MDNFDVFSKGGTINLPLPSGETLKATLIKAADMPDICAMLDDPAVAEYLFFAPAPHDFYHSYFDPIIAETTDALAQNRAPATHVMILRDNEGEFVGMCGLAPVMFQDGVYEIGYQLPTKSWRKAIASTACRFLTGYGFNILAAHKICADCYAGNVGSYKTMEKCGYEREGLQKGYYKTESGFDDRLIYGLCAADWSDKQ